MHTMLSDMCEKLTEEVLEHIREVTSSSLGCNTEDYPENLSLMFLTPLRKTSNCATNVSSHVFPVANSLFTILTYLLTYFLHAA